MASYIIPIFLIALCIYCFIKKINAYDSFVAGAKESVDLCINTFPYLVAIFVGVELFKLSGLSNVINRVYGASTIYRIGKFSYAIGNIWYIWRR